MKYAQHWGAIADHSGDAYFDFVYWHDWPNTLNELTRYRATKRKAGPYDALRESTRDRLRLGRVGRDHDDVAGLLNDGVRKGRVVFRVGVIGRFDRRLKAMEAFGR